MVCDSRFYTIFKRCGCIWSTSKKAMPGCASQGFTTGAGINMAGESDILGLWSAQTEGAKVWWPVATELKNLGRFQATMGAATVLPGRVQHQQEMDDASQGDSTTTATRAVTLSRLEDRAHTGKHLRHSIAVCFTY